MRTILIGIDDTDNLTSPGTGSLARKLSSKLTDFKMIEPIGISRHQFLFDRAIPYTSHNSGACIGGLTELDIDEFNFIFDYIANASAEGSDPGVCIAFADEVPGDVSDFGQSAQKIILEIPDSFNLIRGTNIKLHGLGGNCQGVIGALSSVGLRAKGNDGRIIDMPGLRELQHKVKIKDLNDIGISVLSNTDSRSANTSDICDTLGWARPGLIDGTPVLKIEWSNTDNVWIPVDRKKRKSK